MASNETVAEIVADIRMQNQGLPKDWYAKHPFVDDLLFLANRIEAAHEREVKGLIANLDALEKAVDRVCSRDEVAEIIAVKKEIQDDNQ